MEAVIDCSMVVMILINNNINKNNNSNNINNRNKINNNNNCNNNLLLM